MRLVERIVRTVLAQAQHDLVPDDPARHVGADEEREAAEHALLANVGHVAQSLADPVCEVLVEGHQAEIATGRPNRLNSSGSRGKPVMPTIRSPSMAKTITP